jgi:hypothetical protein
MYRSLRIVWIKSRCAGAFLIEFGSVLCSINHERTRMSHVGTVTIAGRALREPEIGFAYAAGDDDASVYRKIRQKIISFGPSVGDWLRPHTLSRDQPLCAGGHRDHPLFRPSNADNVFLGFCLKHGEAFDLEQAAWKLAQTQYPDINVGWLPGAVGQLCRGFARGPASGGEPEEILGALNRYLFDELGFVGNEEQFYDPDNSYLNRVLDRRMGNPISYMPGLFAPGPRLLLPVTGIGLPGHFVCRYQCSSAEIYVDAFNHGKLLTKADCVNTSSRETIVFARTTLRP